MSARAKGAPHSPVDLRWVRPPRQARSQETLDRILDAAEQLVSNKGFDDTPVSEVVVRAGSSVGAFYARFKDKDGLLYALHERFYEQAMATADAALDVQRWQGHRIPEIVAAVLPFLVQIYRERSGLMRAFVVRNHRDPEFHARQQRLSSYVSERVAALLLERQAEISHPEPERAAHFGLDMVFGLLESTLLFGETRSGAQTLGDDVISHELVRAYLAYLGVTPPHALDPPG